jgi:hypothetical protein
MQADAPRYSRTPGFDRRRFLEAAGAIGLFGLPTMAAAAMPGPGPALKVVRHGNVFLVDGWVLTAGDLRELGIATT